MTNPMFATGASACSTAQAFRATPAVSRVQNCGRTLEDAALEREPRNFGKVAESQLAHQVRPMLLDGLDAEGQRHCHVLVRLPVRDHLEDLALASADPARHR